MGGTSWEQEYLRNALQYPLFDFLEPEAPEGPDALPYYEQPKTDNQKLLNWQKEYRDGDPKALDKIYRLGKTIAAKYVSKFAMRYKRVRRLTLEEREAKASNAATYIVVKLIKQPDFAIYKSFTGYLYLRILHELFYHRKVDGIVDFVDLNEFFKEGTEPEAEEDDILEKMEMAKRYIAYGEDKNMTFNTAKELWDYFKITYRDRQDAILEGEPVEDPKTGEVYYVDELEGRSAT